MNDPANELTNKIQEHMIMAGLAVGRKPTNEIIPRKIEDNDVKFIMLPLIPELSKVKRVIFGFALEHAEVFHGHEKWTRLLPGAVWDELVNDRFLSFLGLKSWESSTRSKILRSFLDFRLVEKCPSGLLMNTPDIFSKLPHCLMIDPRIESIETKVVWADIANVYRNGGGGIRDLPDLMYRIGHRQGKKSGRIQTSSFYKHLRRLESIELMQNFGGKHMPVNIGYAYSFSMRSITTNYTLGIDLLDADIKTRHGNNPYKGQLDGNILFHRDVVMKKATAILCEIRRRLQPLHEVNFKNPPVSLTEDEKDLRDQLEVLERELQKSIGDKLVAMAQDVSCPRTIFRLGFDNGNLQLDGITGKIENYSALIRPLIELHGHVEEAERKRCIEEAKMNFWSAIYENKKNDLK